MIVFLKLSGGSSLGATEFRRFVDARADRLELKASLQSFTRGLNDFLLFPIHLKKFLAHWWDLFLVGSNSWLTLS